MSAKEAGSKQISLWTFLTSGKNVLTVSSVYTCTVYCYVRSGIVQ